MPTLARKNHRRRLHRRAFKSVFVNPPRPAPFKFYLSEREYAQTIGTTERMIRKWREQWKRTGYPRPLVRIPSALGLGIYRMVPRGHQRC
jgi:hypothetical protein